MSERGAAAERTRLAWQRTSISFLALAVLLLRLGLDHRSPVELAAAAIALLTGSGWALRAPLRSAATAAVELRLLTGCVLLVGLLGTAGALRS
jgi:uncharacterized membrane protein YidH (DUF202 family)